MIGILKAPDVKIMEQAKVLRSKEEKWSQSLKSKSLYQYESLLAYRHALIKSLQYPLGVSIIQETQCDHIQSPVMTKVLQKYVIVSTIARDIINGPSRYCGLKFKNIYKDDGCQKIRPLLGYILKGDKTEDIINVALCLTQQETGI